MIKIDKSFITKINSSNSAGDLIEFLQKAIELEHSTIPPYLTAMFSLMQNKNNEIRDIINSVVIEEMFHFTIACNILTALGGSPNIYSSSFVPVFPTSFPMGIGNSLIVGLEKFSKPLIKNIFMEIEEPEKPLTFPEKVKALDTIVDLEFATIGQFYRSIQKKILELPETNLPGNPNLQVTGFFNNDNLFPLITKEDANRAIDIIVEQGEGTEKTPLDQGNDLAHYYRFNEIFVGKKLVRNDSIPNGFSYSGNEIIFDETGVFPIQSNTKAKNLPIGSEQRKSADLFNYTYSKLLMTLQISFNGNPDSIYESINTMHDLTNIAGTLVTLPFPNLEGVNVGTPFEFVTISN